MQQQQTAECPCGRPDCKGMPLPLDLSEFNAGLTIEHWLIEQGVSLSQLKSANRAAELVEARRRVARYLRDHNWSSVRIGRFMGRDHSTVLHLLEGRNAG